MIHLLRSAGAHALGTALAASLVAVAAPAMAEPSTTKGATAATVTTQLPRSVRPTHYAIRVTPDAAAMTFAAHVTIDVEVVSATDTITLQAADLTFARATLADAAGKNLGAAKIATDADAQTASFAFGKVLRPGRYALSIDYSGKIYDQTSGLFALDYTDKDGKQARALYTQFENSDARRFVPSWDEPFWKATFDLSAEVPSGEMAVSNMPVASRKDLGKGRTLVTFGQTPRMSTYLLFFGLGDFERIAEDASGTEVGVIAQRGAAGQGRYALDAAAQILPYYNEYFGTPFPLPKLDNVAGPGRSQFFGAMENWGAIFSFDYELLLDPRTDSPGQRQRIFTVAAHEMAHQWFGDLVTMSWWDDIWLNEGFASWMETRAAEHFHPEWKPELGAVLSRSGAMAQDAVATTHPVVHHIATVEEASQAFDGITYSKGEAVIRMLEDYTGSDAWRDGVRAYMKRYAHGNTVTDDLWAEMEKSSGKPITQIAHDFTLQPGVPLVSATQTCSAGKTLVTLEQGEFARDRPGKAPLSWHVPVKVAAVGSDAAAQTLLAGKGTVSLAGCAPVIVNAGQKGYYRVLYAPATFAGIAKRFAEVQPADQLGMLTDSMQLGLGGREPMGDVLSLVDGLPAGAEPKVTGEAFSVVSSLYGYSDGVPARQARLLAFSQKRFLPILASLGWTPKPGEDPLETSLRTDLVGGLGAMGDPTVLAEARRLFAGLASGKAEIDPTLRNTVIAVVAKNARPADWDALLALARAETSPQQRTSLYAALGAARDDALAAKALDLALTDEAGKTTGPLIISAVAREHPDLAFDYALAHYDAVQERLDSSSTTRFVPGLPGGSHDPATIAKLEAYAGAHMTAQTRRPADMSIFSIRNRIEVRDKRMPDVDAWLAAHGY